MRSPIAKPWAVLLPESSHALSPAPTTAAWGLALFLLALALPVAAQDDGFTLSLYANALVGEAELVDEEPNLLEEAYGFDEDSTPLGNAAVQLRWSKGRHSLFGRLEWEDNGLSPYEESGVNLKVASYGFQLSERLDLQLGRIEVPLGLFNQLRRLGAFHPFSRIASDFYREGGPSTQSVDGAGLRLRLPRDVHLDLFWGEYDFQEGLTETFDFTAEDVVGGELRFRPRVGAVQLTVGAGYLEYETTGNAVFPESHHDRYGYWGFVEVDADRFFLRGEGRVYEASSQPDVPPLGTFKSASRFIPFYAEAGYKGQRLMVGLRYEESTVQSDIEGAFELRQNNRQRTTTTLAASWDLGRGFLAKLETSWHRYGLLDEEPVLTDPGPPPQFETITNYESGRTVVFTLSYAGSWSFAR